MISLYYYIYFKLNYLCHPISEKTKGVIRYGKQNLSAVIFLSTNIIVRVKT